MRFRDFEDEIDDDAILILAQVSLVSFTANPTTIGPFGNSVISWEVDGPSSGGFTVEFNRQRVVLKGSRNVQPRTRKRFTLKVRSGRYSKTLGSLTIDVDLTSCESYELDFGRIMEDGIVSNIEGKNDLSFRSDPEITVDTASDRIHLKLRLEKHVDVFPNPTVTIDAYFRFVVTGDNIEARGQDVSVDIDWPSRTWLIPGAIIAVPIITSKARIDTVSDFENTIADWARLADLLFSVPFGRLRREVRILPTAEGDRPNEVFLELMHCADPIHMPMAELAASEVTS